MILVYSKKKTDIDGKHIDPALFSGKPAKGAVIVYTDDRLIKDIYAEAGVEVKSIKGEKNGKSITG